MQRFGNALDVEHNDNEERVERFGVVAQATLANSLLRNYHLRFLQALLHGKQK